MLFYLLVGGGVIVETSTLDENSVTVETSEDLAGSKASTQSLDESKPLVNASANIIPERNKKNHRLIRQSTVNIPITEDRWEWKELEDAYSSKMKETVCRVKSKMPPEKPKRRLSSRHSLHRTHTTNMSGAN